MNAWQRFWFTPQSTTALGLLRIAFGLVVIGSTLSLAPDLGSWFGPHGVLPTQAHRQYTIALLGTHPSMAVVLTAYFALLAAAICLTIGFGTRVAAVAVWLLVMAFQRRNPMILDSGDDLIRIDAFLIMLAPSGAALSVDRWLTHRDDFWTAPKRSLWAVRLIQLQISALYLFAVWAKLRGQAWDNGTAVAYSLQIHNLQRFAVPSVLYNNIWLVNLQTYATLIIETSLAFLVWNRRARPWVLLAGVLLHLSIELTILVGFFSLIVIASYLAFLPPETADRLVASARLAVGRRRSAADRAVPSERIASSPLADQVPTQT